MKRSIWLGATLAPLTAPIVYMVLVMLLVPDTSPKQERTWEVALVALTFVLIPASYFVSFVFGAPLIYVLGRLEKLSFWWVSMLAAPLGASALILLLLVAIAFGASVQWVRVGWEDVASFLGTGATLGVVIASAFCLLAGITMPSSGRGKRRRAS